MEYRELSDDLALCERICKKHAKSFSLGIRLFPHAAQVYTYALYGFVRRADDVVDEVYADDPEAARQALQAWMADWERCLSGESSDEPTHRAMRWCMAETGIPKDQVDAFLTAMLRDTEQTTYATYADVQAYMYGSASVIGLMTARICGVQSDKAYDHAQALGEAFQLTNFIRDVDADYQVRNRIYLPLDEMKQFGVSIEDIAQRNYTERFAALIAFQTARARELYRHGNAGIHLLQSRRSQRGVLVASAVYEGILDKVEDVHGNVFLGRVSTNAFDKFRLASEAWVLRH